MLTYRSEARMMHAPRTGLIRVVAVLTTLSMLFLAWSMVGPASAAAPGPGAEQERQLVERFAPLLFFHPDEDVYPVNISYFLSCSDLMEVADGEHRLIEADPSEENLGHYNDGARRYYLDDRLGGINDQGIVDSYRENESALGYDIYAHVTTEGARTAVQYWFFYVFNDGALNRHEGDWEMVEVILDGSLEPIIVAYSQHEGGQSTSWSSVERTGDHPTVYVAKGSHANFFHYIPGTMGLGRDLVGNAGRVLGPDNYTINIMPGTEGEGALPSWTDYSGNWGDYGGGSAGMFGQRGPLGPFFRMHGAMWEGVAWAESVSLVASSTSSGSSATSGTILIIILCAAGGLAGYAILRWKRS